jgi:hypothetical protein
MGHDLDAETVEAMVRAARVGVAWETAALAAGVTLADFRSWMARADAGDPACFALRERLERANAVAIATVLACIQKAAAAGKPDAIRWLRRNGHPVPPVASSPKAKSRHRGRP